MTGFGKAVYELKDKKVTVEIKSLNSKQCDLSIRMAGQYREKELPLRTKLSKMLERGKIDLMIFIENNGNDLKHTINKELALNYHKELKALAESMGENNDENLLRMVMRMPEVLKQDRKEIDEAEWTSIESTVMQAAGQLDENRITEGQVLEKEFDLRVGNILDLLRQVEELEPERMEQIKARLRNKLEEMKDETVDENRFEQELIYYLEKLDVTEEKVRLRNHCEYFTETMKDAQSQGKKLGFIAQEIGREVNTLGSKANDAGIQRLIVQMKDELEKTKEQMLNVL